MADFLYPLEQSGTYFQIDGEAATAATVSVLTRRPDEHICFLLAVNAHKIRRGDRIWFRASRPEQRVIAVGIAQSAPYEGTDDGSWRVPVAFQPRPSRRLQRAGGQTGAVRAVRQAVWEASAAEVAALLQVCGHV